MYVIPDFKTETFAEVIKFKSMMRQVYPYLQVKSAAW